MKPNVQHKVCNTSTKGRSIWALVLLHTKTSRESMNECVAIIHVNNQIGEHIMPAECWHPLIFPMNCTSTSQQKFAQESKSETEQIAEHMLMNRTSANRHTIRSNLRNSDTMSNSTAHLLTNLEPCDTVLQFSQSIAKINKKLRQDQYLTMTHEQWSPGSLREGSKSVASRMRQ